MPNRNAIVEPAYDGLVSGVVDLLRQARQWSARSVNAVMTATYWEIGRRIVEYEQHGRKRAAYGEALLERLAADLTAKLGRGFSQRNLRQMREFYLGWQIRQTLSAESDAAPLSSEPAEKWQTASAELRRASRPDTAHFPLPWSHYVRLLSVDNLKARAFYEQEALQGGWSVRQLDRQISTLFYERLLLSRKKAAMLKRVAGESREESLAPEEEIKDPLVLEFLNLKDEYSETTLEEALIRHLEQFLLELGNDFAFVARQKRLRVGDEWYRIDLLFFHRRLRCLVLIDLKMGKFTHADVGSDEPLPQLCP
jgi:predicted nuclease of restriction endonuclease-like (RecB) superfamily